MTYHALKGIGGAQGQMLSWQHTSHLSLEFAKNICGFDSIILCLKYFEFIVKACTILKFKTFVKRRLHNNNFTVLRTLFSAPRSFIYMQWFSTFTFLVFFTEKPCSKQLERNVVYVPIITLSHATSHDFKWRQNKSWLSAIWLDVGDVMTSMALLQLVEKLRVNDLLLEF